MKYRADIDGLRTFAVVPVVLFHAEKAWMSGGYIGVDIFFVISGYLISLILLKDLAEKQFSLITFYEKRARRILPSLLLVMAATLAAAYFILGPDQYARLGRSALATLAFSSNIFFWFKQGDYFAATSETEALLHTWSLAVEEQFYLFYPLILALIVKLRWRPLPVIALLSAGSLALSIWAVQNNPLAAFYLIPTRAWELGMGCIVAIMVYGGTIRAGSSSLATALGISGLGLILLPLGLYEPTTPFPGLAALPPCLGAALLIAAGAIHPKNTASRVLAWRPMVEIGLISYALYLWHWPVMAFARVAVGTNELPLWVAAATVIASGVLAWLTTYFVERFFRNRSMIGRRGVFSVSGLGMAAAAAVAAVIVSAAGLPNRMTPQELQILDVAHFDPAALPNRCNSWGPLTDNGCRLGDDDGVSPQFMLWGDSHAGSLSPAVDKLALNAGKHGRLAWLVGCPPILDTYTDIPSSKAYCPGFNARALQYLESHPSIRTVYLHARWALYATGVYPERKDVRLGLYSVAEGQGDNQQLLRDGLQKTVSAIRKLGAEVVIIEGVPELDWDVPSALFAHEHFGTPVHAAPLRSATDERNKVVMGILSDVSKGGAARVVSITDEVCGATCLVEYNGAPVYRDTNHFSPQVATTLVAEALHSEGVFAEGNSWRRKATLVGPAEEGSN